MNICLRALLSKRAQAAIAVVGTLFMHASVSHAQAVSCTGVGANRVVIAGSSAAKPFVAAVATALAKLATPITIEYQSSASCLGVGFLNAAASPANSITGNASYWTSAGVETPCATTAVTGDVVDIGLADVFPATCGYVSLPAGVVDFHGPVQTMTFVVPNGANKAKADSISAEAAYLVFGLGADGAVGTWIDPAYIEGRDDTSGTQRMISRNIKVPAGQFQGVHNGGSGAVVTAMMGATADTKDKLIGILATDAVDKNRAVLKALAFQAFGQSCGYWPDSEKEKFDKLNVRDGHYPIWGPLHMLAHTTGGVATGDVKTVLDYLQTPDAGLLEIEAKGGVVPDCAMHVSRKSDGGTMSINDDRAQVCDCAYTKLANGTAPAGCVECTPANEATKCKGDTKVCSYGYCEVK